MTTVVGYPAGNSLKSGTDGLVPTNVHIGQNKLSTWASGGSVLPLRTAAPFRIAGAAAGFTSNTTSGFAGKFEAEASYSRVRLRIYTRNAATNFKALVAVTETADTSSAVNRSHPIVGGTTYAAARADAGSAGWATVTVAGASQFDIAGSTLTVGYNELITDWVDLCSVARADGGTRPLVMFRIEHDGSANGLWCRTSAFDRWLAEAAGQSWYRVMQAMTITAPVTTLANTAAITSSGVMVFPEYDYDVPCSVVLAGGDSLTETQGSYATGNFGTFAYQAAMALSTPERPVQYFNCGESGQTVENYSANLVTEIASVRPNVVIYSPYSPNNNPMTAAKVEIMKQKLAAVRAACVAVGAHLITWGGAPNLGTSNAAADALRLALTTHAQSLEARHLLINVDYEAILGTGASPNRLAAANDAGDGVHLTPAAGIAMAPSLTAALRLCLPT